MTTALVTLSVLVLALWLPLATFAKVTRNRGSFPSDKAVFKLLYLALNNIAKKWTMPIRDWKAALNQFTILFEGRMPVQ